MTEHVERVLPKLKTFLGIDADTAVGLYRIDPKQERSVFRNAPRAEELGYQALVGFADSVRGFHPMALLNADLQCPVSDSSHEPLKQPRLELPNDHHK